MENRQTKVHGSVGAVEAMEEILGSAAANDG